MQYGDIVFLDGDSYREFEAALYPGSAAEDLARGVLRGSPDKDAALEYLKQWDYGDVGEVRDTPSAGTADETYETDEYFMSWSTGLSYAGLSRKMPDED